MRSRISLLTVIVAAGLAGCQEPELDEMFKDVEEQAPRVCKRFCEVDAICSQDGSELEGPEAVDAHNESIDACIIDCAYLCAHGAYVAEFDEDGDIELQREVSGERYQSYIECLWAAPEVYDCTDYGLDFASDEDACDARDHCARVLQIDMDFDWNDDLGYCEVEGDEFLYF